jgi:tryptophan synthase alpha chain
MRYVYSKRAELMLQKKKEGNEALLVGYLVAGDPDVHTSIDLIESVVKAGVDIIEIGVPSANPYIDGETIQRSHKRSITKNENLPFEFWKELRRRIEIPIWAMGYKENLIDSKLYFKLAEDKLIDGLVIPDCSIEDNEKIADEVKNFGIDVIRFANAHMDDGEMKSALSRATFIYAQLYKGTTGDPDAKFDNVKELYSRIREFSDAVCVAGFGISTPDKVHSIVNSGFNGAVIGSAFVTRVENQEMDSLYKLISDMKKETKRDNNI